MFNIISYYVNANESHSDNIRMSKIKETHHTEYSQECRATETHTLLVGVQNGTAIQENSLTIALF